ncbi:unnamed protein product [Dovyalis caffra]|uniref:RBR-type E3 ubiquitin transferase n=1 Tax=Dovyalis caffra TaxID=77055 RepID=A0AAV1RB41_9ROSI|nr:unnamed protein product [Dovyalis caffra]
MDPDDTSYDGYEEDAYYDDDYDDYNNYADVIGTDSNPNHFAGRSQKSCTILKDEDISQRQEADITRISTVLSISRNEASILLRVYGWSFSKVEDEWFGNEEEVRKAVGWLHDEVVTMDHTSEGRITCKICYDSSEEFTSLSCGHPFCNECWSRYFQVSIDDGPGCLMLRCSEPSCRVVVDQDVINLMVCDEYNDKYLRHLFRSYVGVSEAIKWCPAPGCKFAVEFDQYKSESFDVLCDCSYGFCWNCLEESHRPVNCETVRKWSIKNSDEAENVNWILANSKPCPKCRTPIEKNKGCMHMTCRLPCKYEFCWLCLGDWRDHKHYYSCNKYETGKKSGEYDEDEMKKEMAKKLVEKYAHYYERWAANESSRRKAIADLDKLQEKHLEKLSGIHLTPVTQLSFIIDAWLQIIEARRILKWTYAYGYYLPENEGAKKILFEHLQGDAESNLERLHHCVEDELQPFIAVEVTSQEFQDYCAKLKNMTSVTKNYFENLVSAFENDLADVECHGACTNVDAAG